ncbi:type IV secretory system conjugative DNA transfer family protein [Gramella sp. GC03-9]|uniref:Type IV secretory system conjugative DNA transfer family protein n=1 Tax=Christiangramia oceanisediminis TaxID=2920386 RepID=A0A9X2KZV5_9FLAO|nr:type IV secretory system conjugative DNA transfer family protein [Gramella oceanisediminis]MCP9201297.1 type IV secretory system conjugative DNA transfer family protein [Gramella oceanisediminis]
MIITLPLLLIALITSVLIKNNSTVDIPGKYKIKFSLDSGNLQINNLRRGVSITGAAGSGKTESVVYNFIQHFFKHEFCGIIHDYKNFELTELAYPLFKHSNLPFYIISFDPVYHRINPIAPVCLPDEESVNEVARVLVENLLEQKDQYSSGSSRFFNDAVEGILSGMIWKLRTYHPKYCTLPHLIALYQLMTGDQLISFLSSDLTSRAMADAFISGVDSERQTAAVKGTLANAFKKISTRKIFFCLSGNDVSLDINNSANPSVVCVVNNPKLESAYSPIIATIMHSIIKQMSIRNRQSSFVLMEEAPTIRLLNMHRIPATLRSYDITTLYIMQDKIQNDLLYGDKASKAILSNLSYQFFGKVNDPTTASYYEQFFELVNKDVISISKGQNLNFDTRITKTKKEVSKLRADLFFRLQPGEFVAYADGKERLVKFRKQILDRGLPDKFVSHSKEDIERNFITIYEEAKRIIDEL